VDLALPPYGMIDEKMKPTGSDVLVAEKIAEDFGVELEIVPTTAASRIPSLQTNKADLVISTLSITPERAEVIDFSPPYAPLRTVLAGSKKVEAASFDDLAGKDVGTSRGTMHDAYVTKMATGANIKRYEDDATMVQAYSAGHVEFFTAA
jgi:polar amino acid transport system substrate-binding protein